MRPLWKALTLGCVFVLAGVAWAVDEDEPDAPRKLVVGTKQAPPFAIKNADGQWKGISIELWRYLTDELHLEYELREMTLDQMLAGLESGELDAAVAAVSVTAERHERVEFCHPHFTTGLGIAVSVRRSTSIWSLARRIISWRVLGIVALMFAIISGGGMLFWFVERKHNTSMFSKRRQGIGMGVWWSLILLLGHKGVVPVSAWGRIIAASCMLASIFLLSLLTGVIASVLTVQQLEAGITQPSDLRHIRVVTVASSTSAEYLRRRRISFQTRPSAQAAMKAIVAGEADAVVYDEALLKYLTNTEFAENVLVLPVSFNTQEYAIALRPDSELRKPINEELLRFRASDGWEELVYRYLGG